MSLTREQTAQTLTNLQLRKLARQIADFDTRVITGSNEISIREYKFSGPKMTVLELRGREVPSRFIGVLRVGTQKEQASGKVLILTAREPEDLPKMEKIGQQLGRNVLRIWTEVEPHINVIE